MTLWTTTSLGLAALLAASGEPSEAGLVGYPPNGESRLEGATLVAAKQPRRLKPKRTPKKAKRKQKPAAETPPPESPPPETPPEATPEPTEEEEAPPDAIAAAAAETEGVGVAASAPPPAPEPVTVTQDPLGASSLVAGSGTPMQAGPVPLEVSGACELDTFTYAHSSAHVGAVSSRSQASLVLELTHAPKGVSVDARAQVELRRDLSDPSRDRVILREGEVHGQLGVLDLSAGLLILEWGTNTVMHAVDELAPLDLSDFIDVEKLAVPAARGVVTAGIMEIELVAIAQHVPHRLPDQRSRWLLDLMREGERDVDDAGSLFDEEQAVFADRVRIEVDDDPPDRLLDAQGAARLTMRLPGADLSLHYLYGRDHFPQIDLEMLEPSAIEGSPVPFELVLIYPRRHLAGVSVDAALGPLALRGEAAVEAQAESPAIAARRQPPELRYVLEAEYLLAPLFGEHDALVILVEVAQRFLSPEARRLSADVESFDRERVFDLGVLATLHYALGQSLGITAGALVAPRSFDRVLVGSIAVRPHDALSLELTGVRIDAARNQVLKEFGRNDRVGLRAVYTF